MRSHVKFWKCLKYAYYTSKFLKLRDHISVNRLLKNSIIKKLYRNAPFSILDAFGHFGRQISSAKNWLIPILYGNF